MKNVVELKLTENWLGHPPGSVVKVGDKQAVLMIGRGIAVVNEGKKGKSEDDFGDTVQANHEEKVVKMQKRNMDKMIKGSINKNI